MEQARQIINVNLDGELSSENFVKILNADKICPSGDLSCTPSNYVVKRRSGTVYNGWGYNDQYHNAVDYAILKDGSILRLQEADCTTNTSIQIPEDKFSCGEISIDLNGYKAPNTLGQDIFFFVITKDRIWPYGNIQARGAGTFSYNCIRNDGITCAAWVLTNENLDYLHCNDLNWHEKTSCK